MSIAQVPSPLSQILLAKTYNAAWFAQTGDTNAQTVQRAITAGVTDNALVAGTCKAILVPENLLPYDANQVTFNSAIRMFREGNLSDVFDVKAYGAAGDGITDDITAIQSCVDAALIGQRVMFMPRGTYKITAPIKLFQFTGGVFTTYTSFEIRGEKLASAAAPAANFSIIAATRITPTFTNVPAIMIQNVRAVRLTDLMLLGQNDFSASVTIANNFSYLMTNSNYVVNGCRDSRYSPYAGIAIDPFGTSVPADGGYPGFSSHYVASAAGASNLEFERVYVRGFVAGIILSPNGTIANCSEMMFKNCFIEYCKAGFAICQSQSRNVHWIGGSNAFNLYCFDGNTYGSQQGYAPHIFGCNMAGKYLFNVYGQAGAAQDITGIHAEVFASIGFLGDTSASLRPPFSFRGCEFSFYSFGGVFADHQLVTYGPTEFAGCLFSAAAMASNKFPLRFFHDGNGTAPITFRSCWLGSNAEMLNEFFLAPTTGSGAAGDGSSGIIFDGCTNGDGSARGGVNGAQPLSHLIVEQSASIIDRTVVPLGAVLKYNSATNPGVTYVVGNGQDSIALGTITVTTGANGTATFTAPDATILETGDLIYSYTAMTFEDSNGAAAFTHNQQCLGIISDVNGTTITITGWPQSLVSGNYALRLQWWNRFHQASTGDTHSNTTVDNVTNSGTWKIGNRIKGAGIPVGTYLTNVVGSTLTLSKAATATAAGVRLYDADVYSFTGTAV